MFAKLQILCWLLPPSALKNALLRRFGHDVSATARIGPSLVAGVRKFEIAENVVIKPGNVFKGLSLVRLDDDAWVNSWNWISAAPEFQAVDPQAGTLHVGVGGKIGSRDYLDCTGTLIVRPYGWVGGNRVFVQTHDLDLSTENSLAGRVVVGEHALVHSCSVLLMGANLPDRSVLLANSTLLESVDSSRRGVYGGSPASWREDVADGGWFDRTSSYLSNHVVVAPLGPEPSPPSAVPARSPRPFHTLDAVGSATTDHEVDE